MKIRSGFVSNSSSSSFLIKKTNCSNIIESPEAIVDFLRNPDWYKHSLFIVGRELGEGDDIFEISNQIRRIIITYSDRFIDVNRRYYDDKMIKMYVDFKNVYYNDYSINDDEKPPAHDEWLWKDNCSLEDDNSEFVRRYLLTYEERYSLEMLEENEESYYSKAFTRVLLYSKKVTDKNEIKKILSDKNEAKKYTVAFDPDIMSIDGYFENCALSPYINLDEDNNAEEISKISMNEGFVLFKDFEVLDSGDKISADSVSKEIKIAQGIFKKMDFNNFSIFVSKEEE